MKLVKKIIIFCIIVIIHFSLLPLFTTPKIKQNSANKTTSTFLLKIDEKQNPISLENLFLNEKITEHWQPQPPTLPPYNFKPALPTLAKIEPPIISSKESNLPPLFIQNNTQKITLPKPLWKINNKTTQQPLLTTEEIDIIQRRLTTKQKAKSTFIKVLHKSNKTICLISQSSTNELLDIQALQSITKKYQQEKMANNTLIEYEFIWQNILP